MPLTVRRIVPAEWALARDLRLEALSDPAAAIAFLETREEAAARPDAFWIERAEGAASGDSVAQLLAWDGDLPVGSVAVLVQEAGAVDYFGAVIPERRAVLVGVYVAPAHRGSGALALLVERAVEWVRMQGLAALELDVHADNTRARAAYARLGFAPTGHEYDSPIGREIQMSYPCR